MGDRKIQTYWTFPQDMVDSVEDVVESGDEFGSASEFVRAAISDKLEEVSSE